MKVCLASVHPRRLSGQIESLLALARELEALGLTVRVLSPFEDLAHERGSAVFDQGASLSGKLTGVLRGFRRVAAVGHSVDVIHINLPTPAFSWMADLLAARPGGSPPLVVGYESHLAEVQLLLRRGYLWRDPRFYLPRVLINNGLWGRLALNRGARYIVASEWQRAELRRLGVPDDRSTLLPNLIDRQKLRPCPKALARQRIGADLGDGPLVGWAGHFHHVKGLDVLLEAFSRLSRRRPDARLALAWSGIGDRDPVEPLLRRLGLGDRVLRLGRVEVGQFLSALDVFVLPYRLTMGQGAFPNMLMEAMAVGVPLVTSDLPLLRELVADGQTALLTPPDSPGALVAALERVLDQPSLASSMVAAQRALATGSLAPARLAARYLAVYQEVIARTLDGRRRTESRSRPGLH